MRQPWRCSEHRKGGFCGHSRQLPPLLLSFWPPPLFLFLTRLSLWLGHLSVSGGVFPGACSRCGWASFWGLVSICRALLPADSTPPTPPRASEGLSPTLSWQPHVPPLTPASGTSAGAGCPGPSSLPESQGWRESQSFPGAPGVWGPQLGQHLAEWPSLWPPLSPPPLPPRGPSSPH